MASRFVINVEEMQRLSEYLDRAGVDMLDKFQSELASSARDTLHNVFDEAYAGLDHDQFPQMYRDHLYDAVEDMVIDPLNYGSTAGISFSFSELGTREELERAYHRHARLRGGGTVEGPYEGQALKNTDQNRHVFWEALMKGEDFIDPRSGKKIPAKRYAGKWEQTLKEYMQIWGDKAPYWLFLQHGTKYSPNIPPFNVVGEVTRRLNDITSKLWNDYWKQITAGADKPTVFRDRGQFAKAYFDPSVGAHGGYRATKSGRFAKRG